MADTLIHAPLAHWAQSRAQVVALDDGQTQLTFSELYEKVQQEVTALQQQHAPATVFVDAQQSILAQMVHFLAIISSGRCAAVSDPDWPASVRQTVQDAFSQDPATPSAPTPISPFYIGFTSGSTGTPKGFRRHHQSWTESLRVCLDTFGPDAASCVLAPGRFSHSLFLFGMVLGLWSGAGVVVQERFSAPRMMDTLRSGRTPCLVAVPSQLLLMLEIAARRKVAPIEGLRLILISGARWMRDRTTALQALFPNARIVEFYGASETSFMAWMDADASAPPQAVGKPFSNVDIDIRAPKSSEGTGQIYVRSPMLFMDYVGAPTDHTAAVRDGDWLSVRDMGYLDEQGFLCLVGRENRMLVTQGKNLFPEELEAVLMAQLGVQHASVHGIPDPIRGQQVVAVVQLDLTEPLPTAQQLSEACRAQLESYKVPKRFLMCSQWPLTASGKTDHLAVAKVLACLPPLL
ncbi:putative acyl--CoA ligase YhfT [Limnohabitans sp. TEGF004]|nr:putative acyl--CoA ligase YhfT [Limnohabitans sp. TEGF004]